MDGLADVVVTGSISECLPALVAGLPALSWPTGVPAGRALLLGGPGLLLRAAARLEGEPPDAGDRPQRHGGRRHRLDHLAGTALGHGQRPYPAAPATGCSGTRTVTWPGSLVAEGDGQDVIGHPGRGVEALFDGELPEALDLREVTLVGGPDGHLHVGVDHARRQRVGPQPVACLLQLDDAGELVHRRLGRAVGAPSPRRACVAAPEEMLTSTPGPGRRRTCAANTALPCSVPLTLTSTVRAEAGGRRRPAGRTSPSRPALLTHRSMRPNRATTSSAKRSRAARSVTSTAATGVSGRLAVPSSRSASARPGGHGGRTAPRCRPAAAKWTASPAPRPRLAPVTTATRPRGRRAHALRRTERSSA